MNIGKILGNVGGAIGSAFMGNPLGFAGSALDLFNNISGKSPQDQSIKAQMSENERNRQFNSEQAEKAYARQLEFWRMQQEYNTPAALMKRYKDAGLNPDLVYGEVSPVNASSSSPTASYSGSVGSDLSTKRTIGDIASMALQMQREKAEIDNIKADTANKNANTAGTLTYNQFQEKLLQGQIDLNDMNLMLGDWTAKLNDAEQKRLFQETKNLERTYDVLSAEIEKAKAAVANMEADTVLKKLDALFAAPRFKAEMEEIASRVNKNYADANLSASQATEIMQLLVYKQLNLKSQTAANWQSVKNGIVHIGTEKGIQANLAIQAETMEWDLTMNKTFGLAERAVSLASDIQSYLYGPLETLLKALPL